eukprot:7386827-Prymnesium_polylepis.1
MRGSARLSSQATSHRLAAARHPEGRPRRHPAPLRACRTPFARTSPPDRPARAELTPRSRKAVRRLVARRRRALGSSSCHRKGARRTAARPRRPPRPRRRALAQGRWACAAAAGAP